MTDTSTELLFLNRIAPRLKQFKQKSAKLWNCRCPICNDSKASAYKARGYFGYNKNGVMTFYCHNCNASKSLGSFMKMLFPDLYNEYIFYKFKYKIKEEKNDDDANITSLFKQYIKFKETDIFDECIHVTDLQRSDGAWRYISNRRIPEAFIHTLYISEDFKSLVETVNPEKAKNLKRERRIIIPFYNEKKELIGFQGRAIGDHKIKYITIKLTDEKMVYGLDRVDWNKPVYVLEGPIDSMFVDNSIAAASSALGSIKQDSNMILYYVYDNQPKNKEIISIMEKNISLGNVVCIWPKTFKYKDINEAVMNGVSPEKIVSIINSSLYNGMQAKLKFMSWKKI